LGIVLYAIWIPHRFLTQDGPSHLYTAAVFRQLVAHPHSDACYQLVQPPPSNSLAAWTGAFLIPWVGWALTEKIWATVYVVLFVAGGAYLALLIDSGNSLLGVYALLLNPFLFAGFWNFNLAVGLLFLALALTVRCLRHPSWLHAVLGLILAACLYFTHLLVFAAFLSVFSFLLVAKANQVTESHLRKWRWFFCLMLLLVAALAAIGILWMNFHLLQATRDQIALSRILDQSARMSLSELNTWYRYGEQGVMPVVQIAILAIVLWRTVRGQLAVRYELVLISLLFFALLMPDQIGVAMAIKGRLWFLAVAFSALFLPCRWTPWIGSACLLLLGWHVSHIIPMQRQWNQQIDQLIDSSSTLERNKVQASLIGTYWGRSALRPRVFPLVHADLLVAVESEGRSMSSNQILSGVFPVRYLGKCGDSARKISDLLVLEISSPDAIIQTITDAAVQYVIIEKAGRLPWPEVTRKWRVIAETPEFMVVETH
jgi:hypothetical protein